MARVTIYNHEGKQVDTLELPASLFDVPVRTALVHEAVVAQQANSRRVLAHTKDRGEVAGTGKKPWKQKGTGRARHGSRRSPIWVGGGITFGPTSARNFSLKLNRKARRNALAMALSDKCRQEGLLGIDTWELPQGKTKLLAGVLKALPDARAKTLLVLDKHNAKARLAARNLLRVNTIPADSLNVVDVLSHRRIIASRAALETVVKTFAK